MIDTKLAYLAGLFDGEGTISCSITTNAKGIQVLHKQLSIFNTNLKLINWIVENFGGTIFSRKRSLSWKTEHQVKWSAEEAALLLEKVLPYLVIKKEQAEIFIKLHKTKNSKVSSEIHEYRHSLCNRVRELNKRGCEAC